MRTLRLADTRHFREQIVAPCVDVKAPGGDISHITLAPISAPEMRTVGFRNGVPDSVPHIIRKGLAHQVREEAKALQYRLRFHGHGGGKQILWIDFRHRSVSDARKLS